ncbi:histidinol dehydrogenase [Vibrio profundum]|uniref:histidinol dehydrogenase n=1 Tax=Vibrio profundum TaxID=2910247 RepID=UPI003D14CFCE
MRTQNWAALSAAEQQQVLQRPAISSSESIASVVDEVVQSVRVDGDSALKAWSEKFDSVTLDAFLVSTQDVDAAAERLPEDIRAALQQAYDNISKFHQAQEAPTIRVETQPGVVCEQITRPINNVGFYIPGGSAPLPSTVLMLGVPAQVAGCRRTILCSPPPIADEILYVAKLCQIDEVYQVGGAQAIAAMAFGTESISKVDKIYGPGNAYVTEAKRQASQAVNGAAIDMPAGPSEVLVIADDKADPEFIASDLLSQAEHGPDSQVILVTPSDSLASQVAAAIDIQLKDLPRSEIAEQALSASTTILVESLEQAVLVSNLYAPEHLIVQTECPRELLPQLEHAGSIFLGAWSPESVGDYASGTNHVLPTYGYTRTFSSLGLADFSKRMTVQELTPEGLLNLAPTVEKIAQAEGLEAHKRAVTIRVEQLQKD